LIFNQIERMLTEYWSKRTIKFLMVLVVEAACCAGMQFQLAKDYLVGLNKTQIKTINQGTLQPNFVKQGYCRLREPGPVHGVPLGMIAGRDMGNTIEHIYAHPHYGLIGVNTTTHAKARFGNEGSYQDDYKQYVPECHCFVEIREATSNGWIRVLDDWTLWMGITHRGRFSVPPKYFWQYDMPKERDVYGWPLLKLKTPRPPEKLLFQRHLDYRVVTLVNLTKNYPKGFKDFFWEDYNYLYSLSTKRATDPNINPQNRWLKTGQLHGKGAVPPDYVNYILSAVMFYLVDHASVSVTCSMEILNKQVSLGFGQRTGEQNTLSIPYSLSGYAQSWKALGPVLMNKPRNGGRFACTFVPGVARPNSVGPSFVWVNSMKAIMPSQVSPSHLTRTKQGLVVLYSESQKRQGEITRTAETIQNAQFHPLEGYPAMWGDKCQEKRRDAKCHKRMVDIETKIRYAASFYDPYNNQSVLPDHTQSVVFFPPSSDSKRAKRQVFATLAVVTAFAVQGVGDYAGYEGIQGVEQELNDQMNTRAVANNVRFRQADNAIGNLSRQIQDLNSKVEELSESEVATIKLLLQTVKTQALEDKVLQQQISSNQRTLVTLAKAHLNEATLNQRQSDAQTFLLKTATNALTNTSKKFIKAGVAYSWQLRQGVLRLQALEKQLNTTYQTDNSLIQQKLNNLTCEELLERNLPFTKNLDALTSQIQDHLDEVANLSIRINQTRPEPIQVHFVPELSNLSLHNSGRMMRQAFNKVMTQPVQAIEKIGQEAIGFVEKELGSRFKIIIIIVIVIVVLIIVSMIIKNLRGAKQKQDKHHELKAVKQIVPT